MPASGGLWSALETRKDFRLPPRCNEKDQQSSCAQNRPNRGARPVRTGWKLVTTGHLTNRSHGRRAAESRSSMEARRGTSKLPWLVQSQSKSGQHQRIGLNGMARNRWSTSIFRFFGHPLVVNCEPASILGSLLELLPHVSERRLRARHMEATPRLASPSRHCPRGVRKMTEALCDSAEEHEGGVSPPGMGQRS